MLRALRVTADLSSTFFGYTTLLGDPLGDHVIAAHKVT
jgi:hypothetical protein